MIKYYVDKIQASAVEDDTTIDKCRTTCRDVITKATEEVVGTKQMEVRKHWFDDECAHATTVKNKA